MSKYPRLPISDELLAEISKFSLPDELGFGLVRTPIMAKCTFKHGKWASPEITPWKPFEIDPSAKVLHYGQAIFEGMKAYRVGDNPPLLFRPLENFERLNKSAERMSMPSISEEYFMSSVESVVLYLKDAIPQGPGESLYIRPFMVATGLGIGLAPSDEYEFMVICSPSGGYFEAAEVDVLIERHDCRAAPGGTGAAKAAGNYGGSIKSARKARELGFHQTMWLDAKNHRYVEELSGMNIFAHVDGKLLTPKLTDTILAGITRDSLIALAKDEGIEVEEVSLDVNLLIEQIQSGACDEIFSCGTAAVITPISALGEEDGTKFRLKHAFGPIAKKLRQKLVEIQTTGKGAPEGWSVEVL